MDNTLILMAFNWTFIIGFLYFWNRKAIHEWFRSGKFSESIAKILMFVFYTVQVVIFVILAYNLLKFFAALSHTPVILN